MNIKLSKHRMNKKGSVFFSVVIGLIVFMTGVLFIPFIVDDITTFRTALDCEMTGTITSGTMMTCLFGSALIPYFIWFFTSLALGFIAGGKLN